MRTVIPITYFSFSVGNLKILFIRLRDINLYNVFKFFKVILTSQTLQNYEIIDPI